jgi:DNA-directed RNA polymerase subunit M/transcription elongation factor TFIIS
MNRKTFTSPGKKPSGVAKNVSTKTMTTSNTNLIVESSIYSKLPKTDISEISSKESLSQDSNIYKLSLLKKYAPDNVTEKELNDLLKLKYKNENLIIDENNKDIIIEIIGMLRIYSISYIMDFLDKAPNKEWIFWQQTFMNAGKVSVEREIFINRAEEIGVKGVGKCRYCTGTELVYAQKQVSSGDEPMRVYVRCITCGQHWKQG